MNLEASLTHEKINYMHALLDKELEGLKNNNVGIGITERNLIESKGYLNIANLQEKEEKKIEKNQNYKLQDEISDLHSKINSLEQKLSLINSPFASSKNEFVQSQSMRNKLLYHNSLYNQNKENDIDHENTPLKQKYIENNEEKRKNSVLKDNTCNLNLERETHLEKEYKIKEHKIKKKSLSSRREKLKIKNLENTIEKQENSLISIKSRTKRSNSRKLKNSEEKYKNIRSESLNQMNKESSATETIILNKKILILKKSLEEERNTVIREKQKNKLLNEEIEKLCKRIRKLEVKTEKSNQLDSDYARLMESFEKSEAIRMQQKQLITNLKKELNAKNTKKIKEK